jgi:hypothetical protein
MRKANPAARSKNSRLQLRLADEPSGLTSMMKLVVTCSPATG